MAKKQEQTVFVAAADFMLVQKDKTVQVHEGETFTPPSSWQRDENFDNFRKVGNNGKRGVSFIYEVNLGTYKDENGVTKPLIDNRRVILPLEEVAALE